MADTKITALAAITTVDPAADVLPIVDVSDTSMAASGTTKKITSNQILGAGGTATLASATITGAASAAGLSVTGSTIPTNGVYLPSANSLGFAYNSTLGMTLNSTGLGVGASPAYKLDVSSSSNIVGRVSSSSVLNTGFNITNTTGSTWSLYSFGSNDATLQNSFGIYHQNGTSFLQITQAGNVGVGVTPSAWNSNYKAIDFGSGSLMGRASGTANNDFYLFSNAYYAASAYKFKVAAAASAYFLAAGEHRWQITSSTPSVDGNITWTQAMTLDASGNLLVGQTTAALDANGGFYLRNSAASGGSSLIVNHRSAVTSGNSYAEFTYNGVGIGSITQNGTTGVLYNINSDYRLKESIAPLSGGLARINALKPSIYKWKSDGSAGEGFIAHELAQVVPFAVTGEKDAVNEDGSIKSQGIDMSRIVPILVAAIKELSAEVNALKNA